MKHFQAIQEMTFIFLMEELLEILKEWWRSWNCDIPSPQKKKKNKCTKNGGITQTIQDSVPPLVWSFHEVEFHTSIQMPNDLFRM